VNIPASAVSIPVNTPSSAGPDRAPAEQPPLAGFRVLDLTRILSGPYASMLLADLGAEVVKVERPGSGDDTRSWGPPFWNGMSTYFAAVNRGKRSVCIDLQHERGRGLVRALAGHVDAVIENFRPGVTRRLGIDYESLRASNPRLIYASITGFGSSGPKAPEAGTEVIVEAETGLMAMMGPPDGPPVRFGVAMVDIATGMALVGGVLAAALARDRTGHGRRLEFPLYATAFSCLATVVASASVDPASQEGRWGSGHPSIVPYAAFAVSDGFVVLGAINELMWHRLCDSLGMDELRTDPRAETNERRVHNRSFVDAALADALAKLPTAAVTERLGSRGVLVAPVRTAGVAVEDPQVAELGLLEEIDGVRFTHSPLRQFNPAPLSRAQALGEDSAAVLGEYLGLPADEIASLIDDGVVDLRDDASSVRLRSGAA
jgi:crotonobetainyl-CoA:carnitine CoA-transferase CaiB-like acyl-CoA transferase